MIDENERYKNKETSHEGAVAAYHAQIKEWDEQRRSKHDEWQKAMEEYDLALQRYPEERKQWEAIATRCLRIEDAPPAPLKPQRPRRPVMPLRPISPFGAGRVPMTAQQKEDARIDRLEMRKAERAAEREERDRARAARIELENKIRKAPGRPRKSEHERKFQIGLSVSENTRRALDELAEANNTTRSGIVEDLAARGVLLRPGLILEIDELRHLENLSRSEMLERIIDEAISQISAPR